MSTPSYTTTLTAKEASEIAIQRIKADPDSWDQTAWHQITPCGTSHCYAGHIDVLLGPKAVEEILQADHECYCEDPGLVHDVQGFLGLSDRQWSLIADLDNSIEMIEVYHNQFFVLGQEQE